MNVGDRRPLADCERKLLQAERTLRPARRRRIVSIPKTVPMTIVARATRGQTLVTGVKRGRHAAALEIAYRQPAAEIIRETDRARKTGFDYPVRARQVDVDCHHI